MNISIDMLLYHLEQLSSDIQICNYIKRSFGEAKLYTPAMQQLSDQHIYVMNAKQLSSAAVKHKGKCFLVNIMPKEKAIHLGENNNTIIQVQCSNLAELLNSVQDYFNKLRQWDVQLQLAYISHQDVQHFLDVSREWIPYGVCIWDPSFSLLAYSKDRGSDNFLYQEFVSRGYLSAKIVNRFVNKYMWNTATRFCETTIHRPPNVANSIEIMRSLTIKGNTAAIFCMFCEDTEPHGGLFEIVDHLCNALQKHYDYLENQSHYEQRSCEYFLLDLLEGRTPNSEELEERCKYLKLPLNGKFHFFRFIINPFSLSHCHLIMSRLRRHLPSAEVFLYRNSICMFSRDSTQITSDERAAQLDEFLKLHNAFCGISERFSLLSDIRIAFLQSTAALELGQRLSDQGRNFFFYRDYYFHHILSRVEGKASLRTFCFPPLFNLIESDMKTGNNNLLLLRVYLNNDRNITQTAQVLHLHRNSVIYRLDRISEIMDNSDFNNAEIRFHILVSMKILDHSSGFSAPISAEK